jgi:hypothetical protein
MARGPQTMTRAEKGEAGLLHGRQEPVGYAGDARGQSYGLCACLTSIVQFLQYYQTTHFIY